MPACRFTARAVALVALLAAALPAGASAFPIESVGRAPAANTTTAATIAVQERLPAAGVYDLSVTVTARSADGSFMNVEIGPLARRARIDERAHRAKLRLTLAINRRSFAIRVTPAQADPLLQVSLRRIGPVAAGTAARSIAVANVAVSDAATRPSGTVSGPAAKSTSAAALSGPVGPTDQTGPTGPTGSTGAPPPVTPPAPPAVEVPTTGPGGNPILALPNGFAPVINYGTPVQDYEFDGASLPSDWSAGTWSHGFAATLFQPSQVSMTGSSVALPATEEPSGPYPYQSGWISTEGSFSMTYGLVDFRAKMPAGQGLWSGLWLDQPDGGDPWGEIDVQEMLLGDTHTVYGSLHGWAPSLWAQTQSTSLAADASAGFHDYQVVWQPGMITWAIDGVAYAQYTAAQAAAAGQPWPFDDGTGFYLIADLAVAGPSDWGGPPNAATVFPATMTVQSVKVWE